MASENNDFWQMIIRVFVKYAVKITSDDGTESEQIYCKVIGYLRKIPEGTLQEKRCFVEALQWNKEIPKELDTFIFPILFSYRHSLEISLKHIYMRARGIMPKGGHSLLDLWDCIKKEIIDNMICSEDFINQVKAYKENFIKYSLNGINLKKIRQMLQELQEANQRREEIKNNVRQVDQNAEVWRCFYFRKHLQDIVPQNGL